MVLHVLAIWGLLWLGDGSQILSRNEPPDQEQIPPPQTRIIWYHLQKLPVVSSEKGPENSRHPEAVRISKDVIISHTPQVPPTTQIVRTPDDVQTPAPPVPAPNLIAVKKGSEALPEIPEPPLPVLPGAAPIADAIDLRKPPPKQFVPPTLSSRKTPPTTPSAIPVPEPPIVSPGGAGGSNDVNALVLSLLPGRGAVPPPGRADASSAPPSNGPGGESRGPGIQIAGVTVRPEIQPPKPTPPPPPAETGPKTYVTTSVAPLQSTLSAPLPPSSRTVPQSIEARFRGRVLYAVIIPMKKVPGYSGDWTIWFAAHQVIESAGLAAQMRAPLPIRKSVDQTSRSQTFPQGRVQISAVIDKLGKLESINVVGRNAEASTDAAIADLKSWEFIPALRNHEPVDVDVLFEIYYLKQTDGTSTIGTPEH